MGSHKPSSEPIALIGSSCRFSGGATSPQKLGEILLSPTDLSQAVPPNRFNVDGFFHPDAEYHGTTNSTKAYWLQQDHRAFDAQFFGISPREAEAMDPQQRLLLEVVYEALESAGYTLPQCAGQDIAVFAGVMTGDYETLSARDDLNTSQYAATGNARSIISNRVSYFFDFRGPSMTIDTACSASLVALHQAVQSLRSGEAPMACVAGVNLMLTPEQFISESNLHMLSPTGHSRMWDANADGYARGEGVAALFIKPLSRAIVDGDCVQAIIRETGVNSDGRTQGITMPSPAAQAALIRNTYKKSGLDPTSYAHQPQYFEAHGTGTPVGDPLEARAIAEAFFGDTQSVAGESDDKLHGRKLVVGSVKTVIGHTEGAAGLAGVLKVVQAMQCGQILPNLHLDSLNPKVLPFYRNLHIPTRATAWPSPPPGQPCRASVNSFGFGGTNSHAIIERYEPEIHDAQARLFDARVPVRTLGLPKSTPDATTLAQESIILPLVFSAASQKSLLATLSLHKDYLLNNVQVSLQDLAWHLYRHRTAHPFRVSIVAGSLATAVRSIDSLIQQGTQSSATDPGIGRRAKQLDRSPRILGIFTGQGAQYASMSKGLFQSNPVYRGSIETLDQILATCPDPPEWTLQEQLLAGPQHSRIPVAEVSQPLCTALQIAIVDVLRSINVNFHTVVGHSSGEIAAAYAAGRLTQKDAILISYYRGRLAHLACGTDGTKGAMLACGLSRQEAEDFCAGAGFKGRLCIAASNSPTLTSLSGDVDAVERALVSLQGRGKFARRLKVDTAYHSFHMRRPVDAYSKVLERCNIQPCPASNGVQWVSSVLGSGQAVDTEDLAVKYWGDNMISTVLFHEAVKVAAEKCGPLDCAIEVGPHPALMTPCMETLKGQLAVPIPYIGVLDRKTDDQTAFANFLGMLWASFGPSSVDMETHIRNSTQPELLGRRLPDPPSYAWDHSQIHWRESRLSEQYHFRENTPNELLGVRTRDDNQFQLRWRNILKTEKLPWMEGHKFQGQTLLPASAYCVMALDAAKSLFQAGSAAVVELQDLEFLAGITIEAGSLGVETLFSLAVTPSPPGTNGVKSPIEAEFTLTSVPVTAHDFDAMKKNFSGKMRLFRQGVPHNALPSRSVGPRAETLPVNIESFYQMMGSLGLQYTGPFKALKRIDRRLNYAAASLDRVHPLDTTVLSVSPATLDTCFQSTFAAFSSPGDKALWTSFLPTKIEKIRFNLATTASSSTISVESHLKGFEPYSDASAASMTADLSIFNSCGETEIQVENLTVSSFASTKPEDDYELYLHTVMDLDPEDEIVTAPSIYGTTPDPVLVESCERVAHFFTNSARYPAVSNATPASPITPALTRQEVLPAANSSRQSPEEDQMLDFIRKSPYFSTLDFIRTQSLQSPRIIPDLLPSLVEEAQHLIGFQKHLRRVVQQIAHRYPRMNVLTLTDPDFSFTEHVLDGLQDSFLSIRVGGGAEYNLHDRVPLLNTNKKASLEKFHLTSSAEDTLFSADVYDLVILSTSLLEDTGVDQFSGLKRIRKRMKEGGFLIMINLAHNPLKNRVGTRSMPNDLAELLLTPPDWPDLLEACDFVPASRNCDQQHALGFSLSIRQAATDFKQTLLSPNARHSIGSQTEHLLLIGGKTGEVNTISSVLKKSLSSNCSLVSTIRELEDLEPAVAVSCSVVIMLADLEEALCPSMTARRLEVLNSLIRPEMTILWVTKDAREDPNQAASFGLTRTLMAETPGLILQVLDLDELRGCVPIIISTFRQLWCSAQTRQKFGTANLLWSCEPEIHVENGKRLIPRVLPYKPAIGRLNAYRRSVSRTVNTLDSCILLNIVHRPGGTTEFRPEEAGPTPPGYSTANHETLIHVEYSSCQPILSSHGQSFFVYIGRAVESGAFIAGLSSKQASIVQMDFRLASELLPIVDFQQLAATLPPALFALEVLHKSVQKNIVLVGPEATFLRCMRQFVSNLRVQDRPRLLVLSCAERLEESDNISTYIHPWSTSRQVKCILPKNDCVVFDFLPEGSQLSKTLSGLAHGFHYQRPSSLLKSQTAFPQMEISCSEKIQQLWTTALTMALDMTSRAEAVLIEADFLTPAQLVGNVSRVPRFSIIDWTADRLVSIQEKPLVQSSFLRDDRTYILVGLTRDLGQSLCRLFVEQGAHHIIVCSRNPDMSPAWVAELNSEGANVRVMRVDVTSLDDLTKFKVAITSSSSGMPPVAGIINGAMVLDDRVFSQMDIETWTRVMRPKTVGSKNLDIVFDSKDLEFFIMTSSFAAIGGHGGQSNYAAANMYMNGLAADRRRRGLTGSVLNIGVIYGVGFLARERQDIYGGLEKDGYPPISERDVHHMIIEAIHAGRPVAGQITDLTTGLARYSANDPNPLHWHRDPRFCHFTLDAVVDQATEAVQVGQQKQSLTGLLNEAESVDAVQHFLTTAFCGRMETTLQLPENSVNEENSIVELGVDSLAAVEIRKWLYKSAGRDVPVMKILGSSSIYKLCHEIAENIVLDRGEPELSPFSDPSIVPGSPSGVWGRQL